MGTEINKNWSQNIYIYIPRTQTLSQHYTITNPGWKTP